MIVRLPSHVAYNLALVYNLDMKTLFDELLQRSSHRDDFLNNKAQTQNKKLCDVRRIFDKFFVSPIGNMLERELVKSKYINILPLSNYTKNELSKI